MIQLLRMLLENTTEKKIDYLVFKEQGKAEIIMTNKFKLWNNLS